MSSPPVRCIGSSSISPSSVWKAASVKFITIHLAMAIGGKGFVTFTGDVAAVQAATDAGSAVIEKRGLLVEKVVIPSPRPEIVRDFV